MMALVRKNGYVYLSFVSMSGYENKYFDMISFHLDVSTLQCFLREHGSVIHARRRRIKGVVEERGRRVVQRTGGRAAAANGA
jgi:hypothetical protein